MTHPLIKVIANFKATLELECKNQESYQKHFRRAPKILGALRISYKGDLCWHECNYITWTVLLLRALLFIVSLSLIAFSFRVTLFMLSGSIGFATWNWS